jgi:hypothetical protein
MGILAGEAEQRFAMLWPVVAPMFVSNGFDERFYPKRRRGPPPAATLR